MKVFSVALLCMTCVGTSLLFEGVNGASDIIGILSPDGSYIPGAALAWKDVFHKMGQVSNLSGLKYVLLLKVETDHFDATLINGDLVATTHHLNKMVTYLKELIPHLKNKSYQLRVGEALMRAEMLVAKLSTGGGTIRDIDDFFKAESRICNSHLTQLLEGIIDLVEGVLEVTGVLNLIR